MVGPSPARTSAGGINGPRRVTIMYGGVTQSARSTAREGPLRAQREGRTMSNMWGHHAARARRECSWTMSRGSITNYLRELNGTLSFNEIALIYRHACDLTSTPGSDPGPTTFSCDVIWIDQAVPVSTGGMRQRYGFLSGAARAFGVGDKLDEVEDAGDDHGVSHDTTSLQ